MSIAAILEEGQQVAASLFDEKEYVTKFGSTGDEDPWDESAVDKDGWVQVMVDTVAKHLPQPPVNPGAFELIILRLVYPLSSQARVIVQAAPEPRAHCPGDVR